MSFNLKEFVCRVKAWPEGRLEIKGEAANIMAAEKWGITPVDLDIKFGKPLAMHTLKAMMTHSGQLYVYAGCALPTEAADMEVDAAA